MNEKRTFMWDEENKYKVKKMIDLDSIIDSNPCSEILVNVIKALPRKTLFLVIDPNSYHEFWFEQSLNKFIKALRKLPDVLSWEIINFLEAKNFLKWYDPTDEEYKRYLKNKRRREQRKKAKKNKSK